MKIVIVIKIIMKSVLFKGFSFRKKRKKVIFTQERKRACLERNTKLELQFHLFDRQTIFFL